MKPAHRLKNKKVLGGISPFSAFLRNTPKRPDLTFFHPDPPKSLNSTPSKFSQSGFFSSHLMYSCSYRLIPDFLFLFATGQIYEYMRQKIQSLPYFIYAVKQKFQEDFESFSVSKINALLYQILFMSKGSSKSRLLLSRLVNRRQRHLWSLISRFSFLDNYLENKLINCLFY